MEFNELANLVKTRRSIRAWQEKDVPEQMLMEAIELATWAPNGGNAQNWHFYIILNKAVIKSIADATAAGLAEMMAWPEMALIGGVWPPAPPPGANRPAPRPNILGKAPALIAVTTRKIANPLEKVFAARAKVDPKGDAAQQANITIASRIQSVSAAIAYLLLVLHQMGLGAVWMTGPLPQSKGEIEKILKVPAETDVVALIPVGYPAETPVNTRKPVSEVCQVIK